MASSFICFVIAFFKFWCWQFWSSTAVHTWIEQVASKDEWVAKEINAIHFILWFTMKKNPFQERQEGSTRPVAARLFSESHRGIQKSY